MFQRKLAALVSSLCFKFMFIFLFSKTFLIKTKKTTASNNFQFMFQRKLAALVSSLCFKFTFIFLFSKNFFIKNQKNNSKF